MDEASTVPGPRGARWRIPRRSATRPGVRRPRRRGLWLTGVAGTGLVVAVVVAGTAAGSAGTTYRTAAAVRGTVEATVVGTGTIAPVNQAILTFPIAGTVATVPVAVGLHVTVGQQLAQLDTTALQAQVATAQSTLAAAQNRLASDESGQTGSGSAVVPAAFVTARSRTVARGTGARGGSASVAGLQAQLVADQHSADVALTREKVAISSETAACAAMSGAAPAAYMRSTAPASESRGGSGAGRPGATSSGLGSSDRASAGGTSSGGGPSGSGSSSGSISSGPAAGAGAAPAPTSGCQDAIGAVLSQQLTVSQDLQDVAADEAALDDAIRKATPAPRAEGGPSSPTAPPPAPAGGGAGAAARGSSGSGGSRAPAAAGSGPGGAARTGAGGAPRSGGAAPVSGEQLAADQATIDADSAAVAVAQQSLGQATLVSPIDGTVGSVTLAPGQAVPAGSGSAAARIVVIGPGTDQVTTHVSDVDVDAVKAGAAATITPNGTGTPVAGTVVSVGVLNTSTGPSPSYPVVIGLTGPTPALADGQGAAVSITTARVADVVAVPSSAVHALGADHTVTVLRDGAPAAVAVQVGAVGPALTEIISGLDPGEQVVLADLGRPLPVATPGPRFGGGPAGGARPGG